MNTYRSIFAVAAAILVSGCAAQKEIEERRAAIEADISEIVSLSRADGSEARDCLADHEYDGHRGLGKHHLLFVGRGDRRWVNVLRGPCPDLWRDEPLVFEPFGASRLCDADQFYVARRIGGGIEPSGPRCALGEFIRVTPGQVEEIEARLEDW